MGSVDGIAKSSIHITEHNELKSRNGGCGEGNAGKVGFRGCCSPLPVISYRNLKHDDNQKSLSSFSKHGLTNNVI
jgi:hypothetical protein